MNYTQQNKQVRPKTFIGQKQNVCSSRCAFNTAPFNINEQVVIPISSPVLGKSAETLRRHMARFGNTKAVGPGSVESSLSDEKDKVSSHNTSPQESDTPYYSSSSSILNRSETLPISPSSDTCVGTFPSEANDCHPKEKPRTPIRILSDTQISHQSQLGTPVAHRSKSNSFVLESRKTSTPLMVSGSRTSLRHNLTSKCPSSPSVVITSKNTDANKENTLKLNFKYTRQYILPTKSSVNFHNGQRSALEIRCAASSSASSFVDTAEVVYQFKRRLKKQKHPADFTKYIPIPIPLQLHVPKLLLNKMDIEEWNEAQAAYEKDRIEHLTHSGSETRINEEKEQVLPATPNKSVRCIPLKCSSSGRERKNAISPSSSHDSLNEDFLTFDSFFCNYLKPRHNIPKRMDGRFDLDKAELLIESNTKTKPNYKCILYAGLPENPNFPLCHAMTELCVSAMLNFFHPYHDVQCLWIPDVQTKLVELLKDHSLKPRFTRLVYLRKFDAILVLSEDASHLLRHKDTCFLHSIASALNIQLHKLLVLCKEGNQIGTHGHYRPGTA